MSTEYKWFTLDDGRQVYRKAASEPRGPRSTAVALPQIRIDFSSPVQSMADGKWYDSKSALYASYKAQGVECVGDNDISTFKRPTRDRKKDRDAIDRAIADVDAGRVPDVLTQAPE